MDRAWRDPHALSRVSPVPRGLWPHPPSPTTSNSHLPASQASPCSPELYPPSCHPLGSGTPYPSPFQSPPATPHPGPSALASIPSQNPTGLQAEAPRVSCLGLNPCPPCPPQPLCSLDYALSVRGSREQRQCLCAGLAGAVGMAKPWAPVSWLRAPAAPWLSPQQTAVCPSSRSCGDKCLTPHPASHPHTSLPHPRPSPSCGVQSRSPKEMSAS